MACIILTFTYILSFAICFCDGKNLNNIKSLRRVSREAVNLNSSCSFDLEVNNGTGKFSITV